MNIPTPYTIARALQKDLGLSSGIRYARRIASYSSDKANAYAYKQAAELLETWLSELKASAQAGSYDLGMIP